MWLCLARLPAALSTRRMLVLAQPQGLTLLWLMLRATHHLRRRLKLLRLMLQRLLVKLLLLLLLRLTLLR